MFEFFFFSLELLPVMRVAPFNSVTLVLQLQCQIVFLLRKPSLSILFHCYNIIFIDSRNRIFPDNHNLTKTHCCITVATQQGATLPCNSNATGFYREKKENRSQWEAWAIALLRENPPERKPVTEGYLHIKSKHLTKYPPRGREGQPIKSKKKDH